MAEHQPTAMSRVKKCFTRYFVVTLTTGTISFVIALALLHAGVPPLASLLASVLASGLANYGCLEFWVFPHCRKRHLSWKRLGGSSLVGAVAFAARYGVLALGIEYLAVPPPLDYAVPLALAYCVSFTIGYLMRALVVFRHHNVGSTRMDRPTGPERAG